MRMGAIILTLCACCVLAGSARAATGTDDPDLWVVAADDPITPYLDRSLFDGGALPGGIESVLDSQGDLSIIKVGQVEGLADGSSYLLNFAAGTAYRFRPFHVLASAKFSPDQARIAAVLSEPSDHAIMIYSLADGQGQCLASIQAVEGSVLWLDEGRILYTPWVDGQPGSQQVVVDLATAEYRSKSTCSIAGAQVVPMVYSCGGTNDDASCGGDNPYPCCSNGGNCTWWAWDRACRYWGVALPAWGNAHSWYSNAQSAGYSTGTTPQIGSIAVDTNDTFGSYGHVAWVLSYTTTTLTVSEQNCCTGCNYGDRTYTWPRSYFDGYIYSPGAPTIGQQPSSVTVCAGYTASFSVSAGGTGTLHYQWQKNSANITDGGHYAGCTGDTLVVTACTSTEVANYRCAVTDDHGTTNSSQASLSLRTATAVTQNPSSQQVSLGASAQFTVAGTGYSTLAYQWLKYGTNITNGGHYSGCTSATLTVSSCTRSEMGSYSCTISAACGSATSNAAGLVVGQPGDFDGDGDVDVEDFGVLQACLGITDLVATPDCSPSDLNADGLINHTDVTRLVGCMSGPSVQADSNCLP